MSHGMSLLSCELKDAVIIDYPVFLLLDEAAARRREDGIGGCFEFFPESCVDGSPDVCLRGLPCMEAEGIEVSKRAGANSLGHDECSHGEFLCEFEWVHGQLLRDELPSRPSCPHLA